MDTRVFTKLGLSKKVLKLIGSNDIIVKVIAVGVNRIDLDLMASGKVEVPGVELTGIVEHAGEK